MKSRVVRLPVVLALAATGVGVAACGTTPKPDPVANAFVTAIQAGDYATAAKSTTVDATTLSAPYQQLLSALKAQKVAISLNGPINVDAAKRHASVQLKETVTPAGYAPWSWAVTLPLVRTGKTWQVQWTPQVVHPQLVAGETFALTSTFSHARADIVGAGGQTLVGTGTVYNVGMTPSRMADPKAELKVLAHLLARVGITAEQLQADYTAGSAKPNMTVPIVTLRESDFDPIGPELYALAGVPYSKATASLAPSPTFAHALLGRVGAATADDLKKLGAGYSAASQVGRSGLEQTYEQRLAGTPDVSVVLQDSTGKTVSTLTSFPGTAGQPVTITLDPKVQAAAETALGPGSTTSSDVTAMVAIQPSTGNILAVANRPSTSSFDAALAGALPPGSTFKVVSTTGLLSAGVTPDTPVPCTPSYTVQGEVFHNFQGESVPGTVPFSKDFAMSCNTAFISLWSKLQGGLLAQAAAEYGLGGSWQIGVPVNHGSVPAPKDNAELASDVIGQGTITMSPLDMAMVAAAVESGTWRSPQLVTQPAPPGPAPTPKPLPAGVVSSLQSLMALVVQSGTAATAFKNFPGPQVYGKTGTAQATDPTKTDAWFMGYRGDLAFAVVVQNGGVGGVVAAPIAAKFLKALDAAG